VASLRIAPAYLLTVQVMLAVYDGGSLPVGVRGGNPGAKQQQVGDDNSGGRHDVRQKEHTQYQLTPSRLRLHH